MALTIKRSLALAAALSVAAALLIPAKAAPATDTLRVGLLATPNTLNPLVASLRIEGDLFSAIFSGLTKMDDRGHIRPDLAREVPTAANGGISADGKTITYHLRPNVKWQDGVPLTADDVAFTYAEMIDPGVGFPARSRYDPVASVTAPDALTVVIRLKNRWPDAVATLFVNSQNGNVVPKHILAGTPDMHRAPFNGMPIGSGPYKVERWDRGSLLRLRANPGYFGGPPAIGTVDFKMISDGNTLTIAAKSGDIDFSYESPPASLPMLDGIDRLKVLHVPADAIVWFMLNTTSPPLDDVTVRRALVLAIDREQVARNVFRGYAIPAQDIVPPWSPYATKNPGADSLDPAAAAAMLNRDGWKTGAGGMREKNGVPLEVTLTTSAGNPQRAAMSVIFQSAWTKLGVKVNVKTLPINALVAPDGVLPRGDFQIGMLGYFFSHMADRSALLLSSSIAPHGFNYARYRNADVDRLVEQAKQTPDGPDRAALYRQISAHVFSDRPYVPLLWISDPYVVSMRLEGLRPGPDAALFWNIRDWRLR